MVKFIKRCTCDISIEQHTVIDSGQYFTNRAKMIQIVFILINTFCKLELYIGIKKKQHQKYI